MLKTIEKERVVEVINFWGSIKELVDFAMNRHGYGNSNGGFGIVYWSDLDEYDQAVEGSCIPKGYIEVYGLFGKPDGYEFHVHEKDYLLILSEELAKQGYEKEAKNVLKKISEFT